MTLAKHWKHLAETTDDRHIFVWHKRNGSVLYKVAWDFDASWTEPGGTAGQTFGNVDALVSYLGSSAPARLRAIGR